MQCLLLLLLVTLQHFCSGLKALESTTFEYDIMDASHSILNAESITMPGCQKKCGKLTVPYPFGIVSEDLSCFKQFPFNITCNYDTDPPKAYIGPMARHVEVYDISNSELRVSLVLAYKCYSNSGKVTRRQDITVEIHSFTFSKENVLTVVGCDDYTNLFDAPDGYLPKGCTTTCQNISEVTANECSGSGCCQVSLNIKKFFDVSLQSYYNHTNVSSFSDCGYAIIGEKSRFSFRGISDLKDPSFLNRTAASVPLVLDWVIGNKSCSEVQNSSSYACRGPNSYCVNGNRSAGYRCSCKDGYEGNPYLNPGCKDIDECKQQTHGCEHHCYNTQGSYNCSCRSGYYTDSNDFRRCIAKSSKSQLIKYILGMGFGCLSIIIGMNWLYFMMRKKKQTRLREKFFHQNGGLLLRQQSTSEGGTTESTKHFKYEELKNATNNFAADRILGQGGYGIVYRGILPDQRVVAIKKSKVIDGSQVEQFINEVRILTQVSHRNVVKLLGCCLECEVPLLVYEFVPNGTLFHHVHNIDRVGSWLSLESRLRIAAEASCALAYLHSAVSIPIIHRDVKLANILLDNNNVAKISDFGASRLIPMDQTKVTTLVQGTLGYLDPEYFHTGQLTEKSDVYSFGVVFAELLTGRQPICMDNPEKERNLATYFITSMKKNRLLQIIEPRLLKEGTFDQLQMAAQLVKRCLNLNGDDRPTMKEVTMELESLRKLNKHPWANQHGNEDTTSLIGHTEIQHSDLYEIQQTISLLHQPTSPR